MKPGDWFAKLDLKDAYVTIPSQRKYIKFVLQGKIYEFNCLPFGTSSAPWVDLYQDLEASCTAAGDAWKCEWSFT